METRNKLDDTLKAMKKIPVNQEFYIWQNYLLEMKAMNEGMKMKPFSDNKNWGSSLPVGLSYKKY
jgi:hypothetical protein